ncbi:MAG TPA: phasin family protein [Noviherbaspirillum sp.]|uniref:phasin family protein n=1 Tax=Noviherbaspirillum sp. TaxID=1926288 RepID=UPI002D27E597|nr:phasin family protein [Noviherbaspirillum sp.]HYD94087.1 phasin family protein [Noviherbaspirillum sp.]
MYSLQDSAALAATRNDISARLGSVAADGARQLFDLHLNLSRALLGQMNFAARQLMAARDMRQVFSLARVQFLPAARSALDYAYCLATIASDMQSGLLAAVSDSAAKGNDPAGPRLARL